jgi:thymidylate synthase
MKPFDVQFKEAIANILDNGSTYHHERTNMEIKAIPGMHFECYPQHGFPALSLRKIPIRLFVAEVVWYLMGSQRPDDFINQFTKIWQDFTHEDGTVPAAYGYRWRHHFGRDQIASLIKHLEDEPTSRQGVVVTWDPGDDSLGSPNKKLNVPCPYTFVVNIINGELNLHVTARSTDMMLGWPHDVAGHALIQWILAQRLGHKVGKLSATTSHAHIYENHYEQARELIARDYKHEPINFKLPENSFARAEQGDPELVREITRLIKDIYLPQESLGKMKIAIGTAN